TEPVQDQDAVEMSIQPVRAGLHKIDRDENDLNAGENLVRHIMHHKKKAKSEGKFEAGVRLDRVRSAKLYVFSKIPNSGPVAIVEARDGSGKTLASYLVGMTFVSTCK